MIQNYEISIFLKLQVCNVSVNNISHHSWGCLLYQFKDAVTTRELITVC